MTGAALAAPPPAAGARGIGGAGIVTGSMGAAGTRPLGAAGAWMSAACAGAAWQRGAAAGRAGEVALKGVAAGAAATTTVAGPSVGTAVEMVGPVVMSVAEEQAGSTGVSARSPAVLAAPAALAGAAASPGRTVRNALRKVGV